MMGLDRAARRVHRLLPGLVPEVVAVGQREELAAGSSELRSSEALAVPRGRRRAAVFRGGAEMAGIHPYPAAEAGGDEVLEQLLHVGQ